MKKTSIPCFFQCYLDNEHLINHLSDEQAGILWKALFSYANREEECDSPDPLVLMAFDVMKAQIDRDFSKYQQKCEKYRQNVKKRYKKSESENDSLPSYTNDYDSYQEEEKEKEKEKEEEKEEDKDNEKEEEKENASSYSQRTDANVDIIKIEYILNLLNRKSGLDFKSTNKTTQRLIAKRLSEGYTTLDFFSVIEHKCSEWTNDSQRRQYLRPDELFSDKFRIYLDEAKNSSSAE